MSPNNEIFLAGIDLGTTGCKSMVFDSRGNIAGSGYIEYDLIFTRDGVEQDAGLWWEHSKAALKQAVKSAGIDAGRLRAIAVSSQGIASVPVDAEGMPLANAVSWYDSRAAAEAEEIAMRYNDTHLFETTGRRASSLFFPQILHLKRTNSALYQKAAYFLMPHDYLVYRLCGRAVTDYTMASGTLCFDTGLHGWIDEMFVHYGIDKTRFPEIKPFGTAAGKLLPAAADDLGLSADTIVAVGMQDQKAAALGAGITVDSGIATLSIGTASAVSRICPSKTVDKSGRLNCHAFDSGRWITENYVGASGASLKWLRNALFPHLSYSEMDDAANNSPPGANGVFFVPALDEKRGEFAGLSMTTASGDIVRAVLEGISYGIRKCIEVQNEVLRDSGPVTELRVFGGGASSDLWRRIISDVTGIPLTLPRTGETSNLGAAVCAGMALGLFPDKSSLAAFIGGTKKRFEPDPANLRIYNERYADFVKKIPR